MKKTTHLIFALLLIFSLTFAQNAILVKDIYPGGINSGESPKFLHNFDDKLYFNANDGEHGNELWVSDGTENGTFMLKDLFPGSSNSGNPSNFTEFNDYLYFFGWNKNGFKLWRTDGTQEGTSVFIETINVYGGGTGKHMCVVENKLYFSGNDGQNGTELWATDGTVSGTYLVKNIGIGSSGSSPHNFEAFFDKLIFNIFLENGQSNIEPWISDGTEVGTFRLKNIGGQNSSTPANYTLLNNEMFFSARSGEFGRELWKTDGTEDGTVLVKDIFPGTGTPFIGPEELIVFNNKLYFSMQDSLDNRELWASDGTEEGTFNVKNINQDYQSYPRFLSVYNNSLFFSADDGILGREVWKSDGTESGTQIYADLNSGQPSGDVKNLFVYNGWLYFIGKTNTISQNWWKTDGNPDNLEVALPVFSDNINPLEQNYLEVIESNGSMYFIAGYETNIGFELYKIDDENLGLINNENLSVDIYPNPVNTILNINSDFEIETIELFSILGQRVYKEKLNNYDSKIDLSFLSKGSYILSLQGKNSKSNHKIIKN